MCNPFGPPSFTVFISTTNGTFAGGLSDFGSPVSVSLSGIWQNEFVCRSWGSDVDAPVSHGRKRAIGPAVRTRSRPSVVPNDIYALSLIRLEVFFTLCYPVFAKKDTEEKAAELDLLAFFTLI